MFLLSAANQRKVKVNNHREIMREQALGLLLLTIASMAKSWRAVYDGDWLNIMSAASLPVNDAKDALAIKRSYLMSAWYLLTGVRMGLSRFLINDFHHLMGNTFINTGNADKLLCVMAFIVMLQLMTYRLMLDNFAERDSGSFQVPSCVTAAMTRVMLFKFASFA